MKNSYPLPFTLYFQSCRSLCLLETSVATGSLDITKTVTGGTDNQSFSLQLDCSDNSFDDNAISLAHSATHTVNNIPTGTTCSVIESVPTPPAGFTYGAAVINPASVTIGDGTTVSVAVSNPLTPITPSCTINQPIVTTSCNNAGTASDPSDDTFAYTINTTGTNVGSGYNISGGDTQTGLSYNANHTSTNSFLITSGNLTLNLTDADTASCALNNIAVTAPSSCSSVVPTTDLEITKTANVSSASSGDTVIYTLIVNNPSNINATGIVVADPLPAEVTYVSDDGGASTTEIGGNVTWNLGNVNANSSATLNITVIVN